MNLVKWAQRGMGTPPWQNVTLDQLPYLFGQFGYNGLGYGPSVVQSLNQERETVQGDFLGYIQGAFKTNGAVFACILTRMLLFSEARLQWRRIASTGNLGALFGTQDLRILETPWPNGTTGDLLSRMITDVDLAGNFYATTVPDSRQKGIGKRIARLRPDWVTIILGSPHKPAPQEVPLSAWDPAAELVGYVYQPGGTGSGADPIFYLPEEVAHWAPIPDPMGTFRGMSWLEPVISEVLGDKAMNTHKLMYFENGASPNLVVSMETGKMNRETFKQWIDTFENEHSGAVNAYKTLYLGQGANAQVVGANLRDLDYAIVQGHGETRIASAAGVPAIVVGFSEGLESSTYSNFAQARRVFADKTLRPLWRNACASLAPLVTVPGGAQLWYDDRDIAFLKADAADGANIQLTKATAIRLLVDSGYEPDSVIQAIDADDLTLLNHSGLYSVQLQAPNSTAAPSVGAGWQPNGGQQPPQNDGPQPPQNGQGTQNPNGGSGQLAGQATGKRATMLGASGNVMQFAQALLAAKADDKR